MKKPNVLRALNTMVARHGLSDTATMLGIVGKSISRYVAEERPIPYEVGCSILVCSGKERPPAIRDVLADLKTRGVLPAHVAARVGLDKDTVACYLSGKRSRVTFDKGWEILQVAGIA